MDTKNLRVKYQNEWPESFLFPIEEKFLSRMKSKGLCQALVTEQLAEYDEYQFQFYLGYLIDALDMLPLRPDLAFDHIWKALDSEFFIVQEELGNQNCSRFDGFVDRVLNDVNTSTAFLDYLEIVPYQTCEYAAKRVITASLESDNHAKILYSRSKNSLGSAFVEALVAKYSPEANGKPSPSNQRRAGRLLKKVFSGESIELNGVAFNITSDQLAMFLIKVVLANSRNERFHGGVFPPFRSSAAKLRTYAHAYFLLHISYALLLEVFLYREYGVVEQKGVIETTKDNVRIYGLLFDGLD